MDHWTQLRAAIDARGLTPLVSESGKAVAERMVREMTEGSTPENFDPLMAAHNMILSNALRIGGLELMVPGPDGEPSCPICRLNAMHKAACTEAGCSFTYDHWVDRAADDAKSALDWAMAGGLTGGTT